MKSSRRFPFPGKFGPILSLGALAGFALVLAWNAVSNAVSPEDVAAIEHMLGSVPGSVPADYEAQIEFIRFAQARVLETAAIDAEIPFNQTREPADLIEAAQGLCFDRSRSIEKILTHAGFETRHIALYSTAETGSTIKSLITPGVASHAVTEVLTERGWLVVDSNHPWISLDQDGNPISMETMASLEGAAADYAWKEKLINKVYRGSFIHVYGLYSRHGRFYPPFTPIPDIHYGEFLANF